MYRYSFPGTDETHILFDLGAALGPTNMSYAYARKTGNDELKGYSIMTPTYRRKKPLIVNFIAKFSKPFDEFAGWQKRTSTSVIN